MNENQIKIGVVTVTYNSAEVLKDFMESMLCQTFTNWILYCVDNQSKDQTLAILENYNESRIEIIKNDINIGIAAGNNQGIKKSLADNCDYVLLINNDVEFDKKMINLLLEGIESTKANVVTPKIHYFKPKNMLWYAGGGFERFRFWANKHYGRNELDKNQFDKNIRVDYAPTCCVLIEKEVFKKVGLMDENYFVYFDDVDFFYRIKQLNLIVYYLFNARLIHKVSSLTGGVRSEFSAYMSSRNAVYFVRKYSTGFQFLYSLLIQKLVIFIGLAIFRDSFKIFLSKQRGFRDGFLMIKKLKTQFVGKY